MRVIIVRYPLPHLNTFTVHLVSAPILQKGAVVSSLHKILCKVIISTFPVLQYLLNGFISSPWVLPPPSPGNYKL